MMPGPATRGPRFGAIGNGPSNLSNDDFPTLPQNRAANAASRGTWGSNIWGNGLGLGSGSRETSTSTDYHSPNSNDEEPRGGLSSLVAGSEFDSWGNRPAWNTEENSSVAQRHRAGGSPSRSMTHNTLSTSQSYNEPQGLFQPQRSGSLSHALKAPGHDKLNPTSNNFPIGRPTDNGSNGFGFGRYSEPEGQDQASFDQSNGAWTDTVTQRSPAEERRSFGNPDYQPTSSASQSRSGSIPRSRHGLDGIHSSRHDTYPKFSQPPAMQNVLRSQQHATFPRAFPERSGSIQSDAPLLQNLSLEESMKDTPLFSNHRPSASFHATTSMYDTLPALDGGRTPNGSIRDLVQGSAQDLSHLQFEHGAINGNGSQTPDGIPFVDPVSLRNFGYNQRGAITPMTDQFRHSPQFGFGQTPQYSTGTTPPPFDQQFRAGSIRGHQLDQQILDQRLQRVQAQQNILRVPPYQSMQSPSFRGQSTYGYPMSNMMPMMNVSGMLPVQPPRGPRDPNSSETYRSSLLEEFKLNSKNSRKYELKDIYDHVVEFSGDQHGSRFIQTKLESANSDEKERIFRELFDNSLQLMQDVFGNYVIQKFFEHGDQTQKAQLANKMKGSVLRLSTQMYGCRVVQKAIEHVLVDQQAMLVKELENDVLKCVKDQNGNHVIQMAIARVPSEHIQFIIQAFNGQVASLSSHPYGCRVIQRLLERCEEPARASILQELHACGVKLIPDQYGNYVTQHVLVHGGLEDRRRVFDLIRDQLISFSKHKFASNVVEKALTHGTDEQRQEVMSIVVKKNDRGESPLPSLIKDGYANYVIQKLLDTLPDNDYRKFLDQLRPEMEKARRTASGKNVQSVEKKMHRLDGQQSSQHIPTGPKTSNTASNASPKADSSQQSSASIVPDVYTVPTPPPLVTDAQSPPSSSLSSANNSTAGDLVQIANAKPYDGVAQVAIAGGI